jgi:(p)ppGpp synthase/HD superfamily hydrolase
MPEKFSVEPMLGHRFDDALHMASEHHRVHLRKDTSIPYLSHLLGVTAIVLELGGGEDEAIAALLHDAVEDGGGPMMQGRIHWRFGPAVGDMVAANSDTDKEPKPAWRTRKEDYLAAIPQKSAGAVLVSLADKLHNARALHADLLAHGPIVWKRFNAKPADTCWYYAALANAFKKELHRLPGPAAKGAVKELRNLAEALKKHKPKDDDEQ